MKKRMMCLLCVLLALSFAAAGSEETVLSNESRIYTGYTTVVFVVGEYYEVVIPPSVPIAYGAEETNLTLSITDLELTQGYRLSIGVHSPEGYLEQENGDGLIPFSLEDDLGLFDERLYDEMQDVALCLHVSGEAWRSAPAGAYSGRLTFSVIPKYTAEEEG